MPVKKTLQKVSRAIKETVKPAKSSLKSLRSSDTGFGNEGMGQTRNRKRTVRAVRSTTPSRRKATTSSRRSQTGTTARSSRTRMQRAA